MDPFLTALTEICLSNTSSLSVFDVFSPRQNLTNWGMLRIGHWQSNSLVSEWDSYRLRVRNPDLNSTTVYSWLLSLYLQTPLSCSPPWALQLQWPADVRGYCLHLRFKYVWEHHCYSCLYQNNITIRNAWIAFFKRLTRRSAWMCVSRWPSIDQTGRPWQKCMNRLYKMKNTRLKCSASGCELWNIWDI